MTLSKRLAAVASFVDTDFVADIGSDHGLLPIYLIKNGAVSSACAVEVKEGPFRVLKKAVAESGLSDKIAVYMGDGLAPVENPRGTAVIAGMGGMLIKSVLEASPEKARAFSRLVLQPQLDAFALRKYLLAEHFFIDGELMVYEDGKYYIIISAVPNAAEEAEYNETELRLGRSLLRKKDAVLKSYLTGEVTRSKRLICGITAGKELTEAAETKIAEIKNLLKIYEEALSCL